MKRNSEQLIKDKLSLFLQKRISRLKNNFMQKDKSKGENVENYSVESEKNLTHLMSLAPYQDASIDTYKDFFYNALNEKEGKRRKNKKNKNIAVTGSYGAGKSSFIRSYFKDDKKVLYVSLGSYIESNYLDSNEIVVEDFKKNEQNIDEVDESNDKTKEEGKLKDYYLKTTTKRKLSDDNIELSILQQILYSVKPYKIPYSRFNRIDSFSRKICLVLYAILVSLVICSFFVFDIFGITTNLSIQLPLAVSNKCNWIGYIIFLMTLISLVYNILLKKYYLKKINFSNIEISKGNIDESILNKYVDELIHFFLFSKYKIIVFEDIDRLENSSVIFSKLKEINTILNLAIKRKTIQFVYALGDDVFGDPEIKTKFFDAILPIVPYSSIDSSFDLFDKLDKKYNLGIPSDTIKSVSKYIGYTRMVYEIINEYRIYEKEYKASMNTERVINTYNADYADSDFSSTDKSQLFYLMSYKLLYPKQYNNLIKGESYLYEYFDYAIMNDLEYEIVHSNVNRVEEIDREVRKIEEFAQNLVYDLKKEQLILGKGDSSLYINGVFVNLSDFNEDNPMRLMAFCSTILNSRVKKNVSFSFDDIELNLKKTYQEKELKKQYTEYINLNKEKEKILKNNYYKERAYDLGAFVNEKYKDKNKKNLFNKFELEMIASRVFNKNYRDLLVKIHGLRLSYPDQRFINNIRNEKAKNSYEQHFDDVDSVLSKLTSIDFLEDNVCSIEIFEKLFDFEYKEVAKDYINFFFSEFSLYKLKFVMAFLKYELNREKYKNIFTSGENFIFYINNLWNFAKDFPLINDYNVLVLFTILCVPSEFITKESYFYTYLKEKKIDTYLETYFSLVEGNLKYFDISFSMNGDYDIDNQNFLNYVYEHKMFKFNLKIIDKIMLLKGIKLDRDEPFTSFIANKKKIRKIYEYLFANLDDAISNFHGYFRDLSDSEDIIIDILNNSSLSIKGAKVLAEIEQTKISNVDNIPVEYIKLYVDANKIEINWSNIIKLFIYKKFDNEEDLLDLQAKTFNMLSENIKELLKMELKDNILLARLLFLELRLGDYDVLKQLIDNDYLYTDEIDVLKEFYSMNEIPDKTFKRFIKNSFNEFKSKDVFEDMTKDILLDIIKCVDNKQEVIDYAFKYKEFDIFDDDVKVEIGKIILDNKLNVPNDIIEELLPLYENDDDKIRIFNMYYEQFDNPRELLNQCGKTAIGISGYPKEIKHLPATNLYKEFLTILKSLNIIYGFIEKEDKIEVRYRSSKNY